MHLPIIYLSFTHHLAVWFTTRTDFAPPPGGRWSMSVDTFVVPLLGEGCCWHVVGVTRVPTQYFMVCDTGTLTERHQCHIAGQAVVPCI